MLSVTFPIEAAGAAKIMCYNRSARTIGARIEVDLYINEKILC
jgi:hypothetical protein